MNVKEALEILQFNEKWLELGVVTPDFLMKLREEYKESQDKCPEHYRWRALKDFLENKGKEDIDSTTLEAIYRLGESDPDKALGVSIMGEILYRDDCPTRLLEIALNSGNKFVMKIASRQIQKRNPTAN